MKTEADAELKTASARMVSREFADGSIKRTEILCGKGIIRADAELNWRT